MTLYLHRINSIPKDNIFLDNRKCKNTDDISRVAPRSIPGKPLTGHGSPDLRSAQDDCVEQHLPSLSGYARSATST